MTKSESRFGVNLFRPEYRVEEVLGEVRECLEKGWTGLGYKTLEFEQAWKDYTELPYAHFVNSGTAGLHLAVRLLKEKYGWVDGDEIITTPLTFVSTNHVILYERLRPVFADVDNTLCLDLESVERRISPKTRAVMFVGIGGNVGWLESIRELCQVYGLKLILDGAHMAGTRVEGKHIGVDPDIDVSIFSFHSVKNLPTADGGMICFSDEELDREVRKWTWLGINKDTYARSSDDEAKYKWRYDVEHVGFKYHGNSVMAGIGLVGLKYLDRDNAYRRDLANRYDARLEEGYKCGSLEQVTVLYADECSRHLYQVLIRGVDRELVIEALNKAGIYPGVHYRDSTEYAMYNYARGTCPVVERYSHQLLSLPMHMEISYGDVDYVAKTLLDVLGEIRQ